VFHNHRRDNDSTGVAALMFAMVCLTIMVFAFSIAYAALHLWAISTLLLRLMEGRWIRASGWMLVLALLVAIDIHVWG
jgi:hypothetical protein